MKYGNFVEIFVKSDRHTHIGHEQVLAMEQTIMNQNIYSIIFEKSKVATISSCNLKTKSVNFTQLSA